jgi:hypothetical protein
MVKSLLLGSATALVAIAGAQAADLPVKAKPVQYVKICSLYGAGFYYIPGTDFCLKLGGWVRTEYNLGSHGSFSPIVTGGDARYTRETNPDTWRTRYILTVDVRNQTEYGTLRTYIASGITTSNGNNANADIYNNRAFIQWAGFTMGLASSFYDFFQFSSVSNQTNIIGSDTGGNGLMVWAYTAQLGNGLSASLSLEDQSHSYRRNGIAGTGSPISATGGIGGNGNLYSGSAGAFADSRWPDIVGNIRLSQAWGSAQIMAAAHDVSATYYSAPNGYNEWSGHPGDEVGWAVGGGIKINLPMLGHGDFFAAQASYCNGATGYCGSGLPSGAFAIYSGGEVGFGPVLDAVYLSNPQTGLELTEAWSVGAGLQHNWNSMWKTSLYGGYFETNYSGTATSYLNTIQGFAQGTNWNSSFWQIGSRTVWTPTKGLDLSVDVMYNHLNTGWDNLAAGGVVAAPGGGKVNTFYTISDQDVWQGIFRVQRNFYP